MLPICGKLFEKLILDEIYDHLVKNNLLIPNHSGFRPGDSTINQLLSITYYIYTAFEEFPFGETRGMKVCSLSSNVVVYRVPSSS